LQYYPRIRPWYTAAFIIFAVAYISGRIAERFVPSGLSNNLTFIGSFWLAAILYFFLFILLLDLTRLLDSLFHIFPAIIKENYTQVKFITGISISAFVIILLVSGHINAVNPRIKKIDLHIAKKAGTINTLNIAIISDIHLGTIIGKSRLEKIVDSINKINPDLVLITGDVFDEDIARAIEGNISDKLKDVRSLFGLYFIPGNHEYYGGISEAVKYLTAQNIVVLRDSVVCIAGSFYLAGRDDKELKRFTGRERKSPEELLRGIDKTLPIILMDHQPFSLNEAVKNGIDLQVSGHTHHGQLFPVNLITGWVYELSRGYKKKGNTHFYVSAGVGTWGPPVRIGSVPEIVNIKMEFE